MLQTILTALVTSLLATSGALILAWQRMKREYRLEFRSETIIRKLLSHEQWALRSFDVIRHHIGGFDDNALRQLLVKAGALRFEAKGEEMWGLFERTQHSLEGKQGYKDYLNPEA